MDVSTVSNAVNDALAGLPAGTSDFINANIGTPAGQQAILKAGASLGLSQAQIASAVSQATGMTVTPQQVAQVAQSFAAPASTPAPANINASAPVSAPTGTSLSNIAATTPVNPANQPFTSTNPGGVGVSYGQANGGLISQAQSQYPELATGLANGTLSLGSSEDGNYLYNTKTGQQINGNYQISTTPSGGVAINLPLASGAMVQVATGLNQNGSLAPVTDSNAYNVGLNSSEGGFAGGLSSATPILKKAAMIYAGGQLGDYLNAPTPETGTTLANLNTGINSGSIGDLGNLGSNTYSLSPTDYTGQGLNAAANVGSSVYDPLANTAGYNSTGLQNGLGLQQSGSANLASMGGGQGLTIPTATGASTVPNATLGAGGTTNYGTNNLGGTTAGGTTGLTNGASTLGNTLSNVTTGVTGAGLGAGAAAATNALGLTPLQTAAAGVGLASTLGTLGTNKAISNAANTQATAANNVNDVLGGFYNQYAQAQQPYQNLGSGAVQQITDQAPYLTHQFNAQDLQAGLAPNYDFMLAQGAGANRNAANVGGGLLSGNTLQGLNTFNQNYAQNAYQNAFNNYQTQRQNIYGNLSNAAGLGQTSLGQLGQVGSNLAQTYGNVTTGLAASQAGAQTAQAVNNANLLSNLAKTGTVIALA